MDLNTSPTAGQTPIAEEERQGLLLAIQTLAELDQAERRNIVLGLSNYLVPLPAERLIQEEFIKSFHHNLFDRVWAWAGHFRRTDKNMGVPWPEIALAYRQLRDDTGDISALLAFARQ
ncbi:hypothetical protein [Neolewinella sp.]|uniref:hypothetical protein n=1 Tax=Neolewinella sp. TaxID=2993543 RepID=UPI003B528561